jgi:hypothetical protein
MILKTFHAYGGKVFRIMVTELDPCSGPITRSVPPGSSPGRSRRMTSTRYNRGSARVLERNGMRLEAHQVENEFVKGEWTELICAILRREWGSSRG